MDTLLCTIKIVEVYKYIHLKTKQFNITERNILNGICYSGETGALYYVKRYSAYSKISLTYGFHLHGLNHPKRHMVSIWSHHTNSGCRGTTKRVICRLYSPAYVYPVSEKLPKNLAIISLYPVLCVTKTHNE